MSFERTVLIVDDSPEDRETYRRFLLTDERYHYIFLETDYGENGLEVCKLVQPDAILLDFHLPDIDGIEFLCELKTQFGKMQLPVIMLTGRGNEDVAVQAMKSGAADYLVKGKTTSENLRLAIHNILERDRLQQQLEQSEDRFRTSIENMLDCFGIYKCLRDESGKIVDFIVEYVNAAACTNNRMTAAEQIGKKLCEILPFHRETGLFNEYCRVVETGVPLTKEDLIYSDRFNQEYLTRAFDIRANKLGDGFVASWRDITDRKRSEERLRLLESVVVNANDAVIITAIAPLEEPGPRIVYVNQAFTDLTGYTCEEVVGRSPRFLQGAKTDKAALKRIRDALQAKKPVQEELINYCKDGSEFWVEISITPIADAAGQYTHFVAIQRNISDRKQAEMILRETRHLIEQIAVTIPDILYIHDLKERRNVYINRQVTEVLGYTPEAICQLGTVGLQSLMHPEDLALLPAHLQRFDGVGDREVLEFEYRMQHANGEWRWLCSRESVFTRNSDGSVQQILGTAQDITARKQVEIELRRSQERIQRTLETSQIGIGFGSSNGDVLEMNDTLLSILGYTRDEFRNSKLSWRDMSPPEYAEIDRQAMEQLELTGSIKAIEKEVIRKDGTRLPILISATRLQGEVEEHIAFIVDLSDRKRAEIALRNSEERLRLAFATTQMGSWDWDISTGSITWSDNMEAMFGLTPGEFDGSYEMFESRLHPEDRDRVLEAIDSAVNTGADYNIEFRVVFPNGTVRWAQSKGQVFYDRTGKAVRMTGVDLDITDCKHSEVENARMLELAQQAQREAEAANRAKDEFVAMVSHDLRSPLNAILGWAKLLRTRQVNAETTARALDAIERNAQSQAKLLEDLLDVSRMIRGKLELQESQFDLVSLVEESVETTFLAASAKQIHLEFRIPNSEFRIPISGDRDRLQQVLGNLLSNAIKFTPEGGKIEVQLSLLTSSHNHQLPTTNYQLSTTNYAQIQVIDTGNGISPEFLPHVFDRFRQAQSPNKQGGLGLGLAIARHIVELHGGTIHAASLGVGQGATFTIQLPLMPPK
ncbi:PAS domain S-box protein [Chroococcidiopsis sp. CCNUC1]|uniref:PAS domain S-box protein n=1 Tax=Chroococcidiopsis sp. CCNUC1 TaxID=2653189 RepID=UPI002020CD18|nr:PAS domain S-box protein [Chroococcidiopsis sp. CCNUC1]URD49787.1 PAS domain S-box protein [Chroococcidiopsis sp. CCNUC1]